MENTLKQKLAAGARPIGTFFDTASVSLMECLGARGSTLPSSTTSTPPSRPRPPPRSCETAEALAIIEDICAVDGVDGIFVGPFDLSISMGVPGQFDAPEFQAAVTRIVAACRAAGKYCMFFTGTADGVIDGFRRGFDAMAYSLDAALFIQSVKRDVEDIRSRL